MLDYQHIFSQKTIKKTDKWQFEAAPRHYHILWQVYGILWHFKWFQQFTVLLDLPTDRLWHFDPHLSICHIFPLHWPWHFEPPSSNFPTSDHLWQAIDLYGISVSIFNLPYFWPPAANWPATNRLSYSISVHPIQFAVPLSVQAQLAPLGCYGISVSTFKLPYSGPRLLLDPLLWHCSTSRHNKFK